VQKRYEGSDRQVRGILLRELGSAHRPLSADELEPLWPDAAQRDRALAGLLSDGLAARTRDGYALPQ
jgi:A/G-specific adenine glycosylase